MAVDHCCPNGQQMGNKRPRSGNPERLILCLSVCLSSVLHVFAGAVGMLNDGVVQLLTECGALETVVLAKSVRAIGAHAFMVGSSFLQSRNLLAIVHPILRNLMEESGETVNMAVLDQSDHEAIIIDQVQCTHLMRMSAPIGGKLPMHASGAGKAFLAQLSEEQVTKLLHRKGLHAYTHATLVSPVHLKEDLAQTRKRGYSFDDEEHALGLRCLAACIFDEHREPFAAISISGPISRITDDRVTEFGAMVIKAAKEVTLAYGGIR